MDRKDFAFKIKSTDEAQGVFSGLASTYGPPPDLGGDIVERGAFAKTIRDHQARGVLVWWQHNHLKPIGKGFLSDEPGGLVINGQLTMADPQARLAFEHLKADSVRGLSIGYDPIKSAPRPDGGRLLTEIKLFEVSIVSLPMNERALVSSVKSLDDILPVLSSLTAAELGQAQVIAQLKSIDHELKRILPRDPAQETAELLREFHRIDEQLKQLLV